MSRTTLDGELSFSPPLSCVHLHIESVWFEGRTSRELRKGLVPLFLLLKPQDGSRSTPCTWAGEEAHSHRAEALLEVVVVLRHRFVLVPPLPLVDDRAMGRGLGTQGRTDGVGRACRT
jgi:hypothetical protein